MIVSGVQAAGAKGVTAVQGIVADDKAASRAGLDRESSADLATGVRTKPGDPQPVVFPRAGIPMDHRPVQLRHVRAANRYRADGGTGNDDAA